MTMHNLEVYKNVKVLEVKDDFFIGVKGYRLYKFYFDKNTSLLPAIFAGSKTS